MGKSLVNGLKIKDWIALSGTSIAFLASLTFCAQSEPMMMQTSDASTQIECVVDDAGRPGTNCPCNPDKFKPAPCYSGPDKTGNVGACRVGMRTCDPNTRILSACVGEVLPSAEVCDLQDNDCNGSIDDVPAIKDAGVIGYCTSPACGINTDAAITCFSGSEQGICGAGGLECSQGGKVTCRPFVKSGVPEVCNNIDDDCNGTIDDLQEELEACESEAGVRECVFSKFKCSAGEVICPPADPGMESCNGKDDDCNGKIDDKTCTKGFDVYCCQNNSNVWGCTATPNDGLHKNCKVGL